MTPDEKQQLIDFIVTSEFERQTRRMQRLNRRLERTADVDTLASFMRRVTCLANEAQAAMKHPHEDIASTFIYQLPDGGVRLAPISPTWSAPDAKQTLYEFLLPLAIARLAPVHAAIMVTTWQAPVQTDMQGRPLPLPDQPLPSEHVNRAESVTVVATDGTTLSCACAALRRRAAKPPRVGRWHQFDDLARDHALRTGFGRALLLGWQS